MTRSRVLGLGIAALLCISGGISNDAQARPVVFEKVNETDKGIGLGVVAGVPLSVTGKFFFNPQWAVDVGLGAYLGYRDRTGVHAHVDLLWHPFVAVEGETFLAPLYVGVGARTLHYSEMDETVHHLGARIPVGIAFDFKDQPFDVFLEAAIIVDPVVVGGADPGRVDANFGVGGRFYF